RGAGTANGLDPPARGSAGPCGRAYVAAEQEDREDEPMNEELQVDPAEMAQYDDWADVTSPLPGRAPRTAAERAYAEKMIKRLWDDATRHLLRAGNSCCGDPACPNWRSERDGAVFLRCRAFSAECADVNSLKDPLAKKTAPFMQWRLRLEANRIY